MANTRRKATMVAAVVALALLGTGGAVLFTVGPNSTVVSRPVAALQVDRSGTTAGGADPLGRDIQRLQGKLLSEPGDYRSWGQLVLDYVQQAKITVDPSYYPKAEGALKRSLELNGTDNVDGLAGEAALRAAEHNFTAARAAAQRGLATNPYSSTLYGSLDDADTQLGLYDEATQAAQKMNDLKPGVPAFSRAEYVLELRGDIAGARSALQRVLDDATSPPDMAFAHYYLGELAFNNGDPRGALAENEAGLSVDPSYSPLLEGKAKAEAALGQNEAAVRDYLTVVGQVPQPTYLIEAGELLQSLGRMREAQQQYSLFDIENQLFTSNGVTLDTDPTLFYADHGDPRRALQYGKVGIKIRPFIEMDDAYAWALHVNHRDLEALAWEKKAMALGTRNALFYFHAGMIEKAVGNTTEAKADLTRALGINRYFNPVQEPALRKALAELGVPK